MLPKWKVIEKFLFSKGVSYFEGMETQVLVNQGSGEKIDKGYSNGDETWYDFRLSNSSYSKTTLGYNFNRHVKAVGFSGWNYLDETSLWVGFDFDSVFGHQKGLSENQLRNITELAKGIPWITLKRSKSGKGIHLIIPITNSPKIENRKEHVLFAKSVLNVVSGLLGFDFRSQVDTCGGILWFWHNETKPGGMVTIREATEGFINWSKEWAKENPPPEHSKQLTSSLKFIGLDQEHRKLLEWFANHDFTWWWDARLNMLVCHTSSLVTAHEDLGLLGVFYTSSSGTTAQNCFLFPLNNGTWIVRRHTRGTKEHNYWKTDRSGWTYCYFNRVPTISDISPIYGGKQNSKNEWMFDDQEDVKRVIPIISSFDALSFPRWAVGRQITISPLKDAKIAIKFDRTKEDPDSEDWLKRKGWWEKVITIYEEEKDLKPPDELVRHVVSEGEDAGWYIMAKTWNREPKNNIKDALYSLGYALNEVNELTGQCIFNPWSLVNEPFCEEYPGDRKWNKFAPQFMFEPSKGEYPTWELILNHVGKNLSSSLKKNSWCVAYSINSGQQYLLNWIAAVFQYSQQPLPYLFLYGPQESGKSTLHEALKLLVNKGVERAELALTSTSRFNEELAGCILAITDEFNLSASRGAYERLKDWITAKTITIHPKFGRPFQLANTTHWIQVANNPSFCPIQFGDTRIMMIRVDVPSDPIPKAKLLEKLMEEAPAFLYAILELEIPPPIDRLRIPLVVTEEKEEHSATNPVEEYILEHLYYRPGQSVLFAEFCTRFQSWVDSTGGRSIEWSKRKIGNSISLNNKMPIRGRMGGRGDIYLGNFVFDKELSSLFSALVKEGDRLVKGK